MKLKMKKSKSKFFQRLKISGINMTKRSESLNVKNSGNKSDNQIECLLWTIWTNTSRAPQTRHIENTPKPISEIKGGKMRFLKIT